jgi:acetoin utilization protein AcuB
VEKEPKQPYLTGRVEDVMTRGPLTISENEPISDLVDLFLTHHYHGVPVLNEKNKLVGIVRDSEILSVFVSKDPFVGEYRQVKDVMHVPPLVIGPSETIQRATMKMFVDGTRFLVVVGEGGSILGVVTRIDLIKGIRWRDEI